MPTRLLLEGPDIQTLLAQVREEHGPSAKIVSADRVRNTGLAGLFGKQRFELTVEVDDAAGPAGSAPAARGPAPAPAPAPARFQAGGDSPDGDGDGFRPLLPGSALRPAAPAAPAARGAAGGAMSGAMSGGMSGPAAGSPADSLLAMIEAQENQRARKPVPPAAGGPAPTPVPDRPRVPNANPTQASFAEVLSGLGLGQSAVNQPAVNQPAQAEPPVPTNQFTAARAERFTAVSGLRTRLADLGMPPRLLEQITGPDSYPAIVGTLASLPQPPAPPSRADELLVILGDLPSALAVAHHVGRELKLGPACVLVAGATTAGTGLHPSRRVSGPAQAARRVAKLRGIAGPLVLVVDAPADGSGSARARSIVDAVDATVVWAVVDATRKAPDSARYVAGLGRVDALAVRGVATTADPATVLAIGVPVALLDEQPADPYSWAALLCRRLADVPATPAGEAT